MSQVANRAFLIAAYCAVSLSMAYEVIVHPQAKDHVASILGLGFCLLILTALVRPRPPGLVRLAASLNAMIALAGIYITATYLYRRGARWAEAKELLLSVLFSVVVSVLTLRYFFVTVRASRFTQTAGVSSGVFFGASESTPSLIYDYADRGTRILSMSLPVIFFLSLLMIFLAMTAPFVSGLTTTGLLQVAILLPVGSWVGLLGLHYRRDREAVNTRYVLSDLGVEVTSPGKSPQLVPWAQVTAAYHSRLLRYFRLVNPVTPDIVLVFGAPPRPEGTGQAKYKRTSTFIDEKLGHRLVRTWL